MCCERYYVRALRRVPTSGRERGEGDERKDSSSDRKRVNLDGWMGVDGRRETGDRKGYNPLPVEELGDGPGQVPVQDEGGDNNREFNFCPSCHHGYECQLHTFVSLPSRSHQTDGTKQLFF